MDNLSIPLQRLCVITLRNPTLTTFLILPVLQKWKDAGGGKGIVHADGSEPTRIDPTPKEHDINNENHIRDHREALPEPGSMLHSAEGDSSISALTHHYNTHSKNSNFFKNLKERFTTAGMTDRLLRKTVAKDTWLYIAVSEFLWQGNHEPDRYCEGREM